MWTVIGEDEITVFEQYALLVHVFIGEFTSKRNVISHPSTNVEYNNEFYHREGNTEWRHGERSS